MFLLPLVLVLVLVLGDLAASPTPPT